MTVTLLLLLALSFPNPVLTPGATRNLTMAQVCNTKWGKDHRFVTVAMKKQVAAAYHVAWADRGKYEFDHRIPRELGGADVVGNIWAQPLTEAHIKDIAENQAHRDVCAGKITLTHAQEMMLAWGR